MQHTTAAVHAVGVSWALITVGALQSKGVPTHATAKSCSNCQTIAHTAAGHTECTKEDADLPPLSGRHASRLRLHAAVCARVGCMRHSQAGRLGCFLQAQLLCLREKQRHTRWIAGLTETGKLGACWLMVWLCSIDTLPADMPS